MPESQEMPKYKCHKEVRALKIEAIGVREDREGGGVALEVEKPFPPIIVTAEWCAKHNPEPGGYYVLYRDGYTSFSPAEAFEDGYTRIA